MRTKLLCAAVLAACAIPAMAQNNVYSLNVVGYINAPVAANKYAMLVNQLNASPNNNISNVLSGTFADNSLVMTFASGAWSANVEQYYAALPGWYPATTTLAPGQGFALLSPSAATVTFVGEVPQGTTTTPLNAGWNFVGSAVPQALPLGTSTSPTNTTLSFPAADGDIYIPWDTVAANYGNPIQYYPAFGWFDASNPALDTNGPAPALSAAFFVLKSGAANWVRTFNVQ